MENLFKNHSIYARREVISGRFYNGTKNKEISFCMGSTVHLPFPAAATEMKKRKREEIEREESEREESESEESESEEKDHERIQEA